MVLGIFSFLAFIGGVLLVVLAGCGLFFFVRAIFPPFGSSEADRGRVPRDQERQDAGSRDAESQDVGR
ncbi:MAG: hypothetical protein ABEL97_06615 [Salinibacter sp.]